MANEVAPNVSSPSPSESPLGVVVVPVLESDGADPTDDRLPVTAGAVLNLPMCAETTLTREHE